MGSSLGGSCLGSSLGGGGGSSVFGSSGGGGGGSSGGSSGGSTSSACGSSRAGGSRAGFSSLGGSSLGGSVAWATGTTMTCGGAGGGGGSGLIDSILTGVLSSAANPSSEATLEERSTILSDEAWIRPVIVTITNLSLPVLVTRTLLPSGREGCQAVSWSELMPAVEGPV